jgi:hypothetical protein
MNCFICGEKIEAGYLCEKHAKELYELLTAKKNTIQQPDFRYHCQICGEYENRIIVEYPRYGYFCDKDILEEWERIQKSK